MNLSEEEFYRSTPRKIGSLWDKHVKFNGWKMGNSESDEDDTVYNMDDPEVSWFYKM